MSEPRHARPHLGPPKWAFRAAVIVDGLLLGILVGEWWA